ncbi:MarR family winged helix-turn-helix transcriptional regulator [Blastococcus sp. VKM Ac-2987]|uniref:MarR family winged helix-turn-helix transcriptional regulator n=1 Tax=Blastococcus sp. VKM Ac-2987 TaxID=3004141 RepID=UPI0022ABA989|nr:MarR family transcriptional regulator [Blastococcus sp. VKM Ac-2987]MCZ2857290.1 MarR family transcriptional regulator [Blastococcus sp. VKM Ac-2987]
MSPGGVGAGARDERVADDLVELLTVTQRRVASGVTGALAEDGGTLDGYRLLRGLAGGGRTMSQLVTALHLPAPTLTRLVDAAVDQALAYRLPHPDDGRKVVVHLSDPGRDRLRRWEGLVRAQEASLAASLGADRVRALARALTELAAGG